MREMLENLKRKLNTNPIWMLVLGILIGLFASAVILLLSRPPRGQAIELLPAPSNPTIVVHVSGAVAAPGLYELASGSRTQEAIDLAGGPLEEAYIERINLALELRDGQQVYVPSSAELFGEALFPININLAGLDELTELPGIGPVSAQAIIDYRFEYGPFESIEDIQDVPGIGPNTYKNLEDLIDIQG